MVNDQSLSSFSTQIYNQTLLENIRAFARKRVRKDQEMSIMSSWQNSENPERSGNVNNFLPGKIVGTLFNNEEKYVVNK